MLDLLIITELLKVILKKMTTSLEEKSEKWNKTDCHRNNATKTEIEIDNYCESCKTAKCNANSTLKTHRRTHMVCPGEHIKLIVSVAVIVINLVIILIVIHDLTISRNNHQNERPQAQRHKQFFQSDFCVDLPFTTTVSSNRQFSGNLNGRVFHCFHNAEYVRYFFEMVILGFKRRSPHSNINVALETVNQGFVQGAYNYKDQKTECPKPSQRLTLRNLLNFKSTNRPNELVWNETGLYMVYLHLNLVSAQRCSSMPTEIKIESDRQTIAMDTIQKKTGLLVAQPKMYIIFVRSRGLTLKTSDTSNIDSHRRSNVFGGVLVS